MGRQGGKGVWRMVDPKDVSVGQGQEDNRKTCVCGRIKKLYSFAEACQNGIGGVSENRRLKKKVVMCQSCFVQLGSKWWATCPTASFGRVSTLPQKTFNAFVVKYLSHKPLYIRLKLDSSFRSATFRMTFSACHY